MSMPKIEINSIKTEDAINNIISSIALEEAALAHILNAEGEKIRAAATISDITACELIELNKSASDVIINLGAFEQSLQNKLNTLLCFKLSDRKLCGCPCRLFNIPKPCGSRKASEHWYYRTQNVYKA